MLPIASVCDLSCGRSFVQFYALFRGLKTKIEFAMEKYFFQIFYLNVSPLVHFNLILQSKKNRCKTIVYTTTTTTTTSTTCDVMSLFMCLLCVGLCNKSVNRLTSQAVLSSCH